MPFAKCVSEKPSRSVGILFPLFRFRGKNSDHIFREISWGRQTGSPVPPRELISRRHWASGPPIDEDRKVGGADGQSRGGDGSRRVAGSGQVREAAEGEVMVRADRWNWQVGMGADR